MTKSAIAAVNRERAAHHAALEQLAASINPSNVASGLNLWRKLRRIELRAHKAAEDYCNGEINLEGMDSEACLAEREVRKVFGGYLPPKFHVNRDPRGYALKLLASDDGSEPATGFALHQDWGRNQILAPEIN